MFRVISNMSASVAIFTLLSSNLCLNVCLNHTIYFRQAILLCSEFKLLFGRQCERLIQTGKSSRCCLEPKGGTSRFQTHHRIGTENGESYRCRVEATGRFGKAESNRRSRKIARKGVYIVSGCNWLFHIVYIDMSNVHIVLYMWIAVAHW